VSINVTVDPGQIIAIPVTPDGSGLTVTMVVIAQPVAIVYVMIDVPSATLVTNPELLMVATDVLPLSHVPPPTSVSEDVEPIHTDGLPPIGDGNGFIVTLAVVIQPVGNV